MRHLPVKRSAGLLPGLWSKVATMVMAGSLTFSAGCGTVLYDRPATRQADGWTITVTQLKDGPNGFPMGNGVNFVPAEGDRLMYVTVSVRNDAHAAREFSYDACDLDAGSHVVLPGLIDRDMAIHALADKVESFDAGQKRGRRLIFSYPAGAAPTRFKCGTSSFSLTP